MSENLKALIDQLKSGAIPTHSRLDIMNEKRQEIPKGVNIPRFSYRFGHNFRVCFRLQMALPFNPETGQPDETFSAENKFRPPLSVSTTAKILKTYAEQNPAVKEVLMTRAGVAKWDTSDPETLNRSDFKVFRGYRVPLVVTTEAISINDSGITGQDFSISYSVPIKRDLQSGQIIGEEPVISKFGRFVSSVTFEEIRELEDAIKTKDPTKYKNERPFINPNSIPSVNDDTKKKWVGDILGSSIISGVRPQNFLMAFEFPLSSTKSMVNAERQPLPVFAALGEEDIKGRQVYFNYTKKYKGIVETALKKEEADYFWDFIEIDICDTAQSEPTTKAEKAEASRNLSIGSASHSFWNIDTNEVRFPWVSELLDAMSTFSDSDPKFEDKMSIFLHKQVRALDDNVLRLVTERIGDKVPLSYRYVTDDVLKRNRDACLLIYGEDYTDLMIERGLLELEEDVDLSDAPKDAPEEKKVDSVASLIEEALDDKENVDEDLLPGAGADLPVATDGVVEIITV